MEVSEQAQVDSFVDRFTRQFYPSSIGEIFFGSRSRGNQTSSSDFDLFVFNQTVEKPYRQHRYVGGWLFDVCVLDYESCFALCEKQWTLRLDYYSSVLRNGRVLRDDDGLIGKLKLSVGQLVSHKLPEPTFGVYRLSLTCLINDITDSRNEYEYLTSCTELYQTLLKCAYLKKFEQMGMLVYLTKTFLATDRAFMTELHETFQRAIAGDGLPFKRLASLILHSIGGQVKDGERFSLAN